MRYVYTLMSVLFLSGCLGQPGFEVSTPRPTPTPTPVVKPSHLEYVSGAGQTGRVNELYATPIKFKIYGEDNLPLAGAKFKILDQESGVSGADGVASITLRAVTMIGFPIAYPVDLYGDDPDLPIDSKEVELTTTSGIPKTLELTQDLTPGESMQIGSSTSFVFAAKDEYDNYVGATDVATAVDLDTFTDAACSVPSTMGFNDAALNAQVIDDGLEVYHQFSFEPDTTGGVYIQVKLAGLPASICTSLLTVTP